MSTAEWYQFFQALADTVTNSDNATEALTLLTQRVAVLESEPDFSPTLQGAESIVVNGLLSSGFASVSLVNDVDVPAATSYYGTDAAGLKGWAPVSGAVAASDGIQQTVGVDGVSTFSPTGNLASVHGLTTAGFTIRNSDVSWETRVFNVSGDATISDDGTTLTITVAAFPPELGFAGV